MKAIVLAFFRDLQDDSRPYSPGETYPRPGFEASPARLAELSSSANLRGKPLIRLLHETAPGSDPVSVNSFPGPDPSSQGGEAEKPEAATKADPAEKAAAKKTRSKKRSESKEP